MFNVAAVFVLLISMDLAFTQNNLNYNRYTPEVLHYMRSYGILNCQFAYCKEPYIRNRITKKANENDGIIISNCKGKQYFITKKAMVLADTWRECCKYDMVPATIESMVEMKCIYSEYIKQNGPKLLQGLDLFYTAIVDVYPWKNFISCATGKKISPNVWRPFEPDNKSKEEVCAVLGVKSSRSDGLGLADIPPYFWLPVICETLNPSNSSNKRTYVNDKINVSIANKHYHKDTSLFYMQKNIFPNCQSSFCDRTYLNISKPPNMLMSDCGKIYYLTSVTTSINEAWNECCKFGMIPAKMDTQEEIDCFLLNFSDKILGVQKEMNIFMDQYDTNLDRKFVSCVTGKTLTSNVWLRQSPDNVEKKESCAFLILSKEISGINDLKCDSWFRTLCERLDYNKAPQQSMTPIKTALTSRRYTKETLFYLRSFGIMACTFAFCSQEVIGKLKPLESSGTIIKNCNNSKVYLLRNKAIKFADIWNDCCSYGMIPATIESQEEIECLYLVNKDLKLEKNNEYFTSYVDAYANRNFVSCATGKEIPQRLWRNIEPNNHGRIEACGMLDLANGTKGYKDVSCKPDFLRPALCEMPSNPDTIENFMLTKVNFEEQNFYSDIEFTYVRDNFNLNCKWALCDNHIEKYERLPGKILTACGRHYMIINKEIPTPAVWTECCKYGMIPATIDNLQDLKCFDQEVLEKEKLSIPPLYMGHMDSNFSRKLMSCVTGATITTNMFHSGDPNNRDKSEACLTMRKIGMNLLFNDDTCTSMYAVLCESPWNQIEYSEKITATGPTFYLPKTLSITSKYYDSNTTFYVVAVRIFRCEIFFCSEEWISVSKKNVEDKSKFDIDNAGKIIQCGNIKYMLSHKKVQYAYIWKECCSLGMIPASIENKDQLKCLYQKYMPKLGKDATPIFFTAQTDANLERRFMSCASGKLVNAEVWLKDEPDNKDSKESCVALRFDKMENGLIDVNCGESLNFICESIDEIHKFSTALNTI